jgi:hypothetical protein
MFNTDFVTAKQLHERQMREAQQRQATFRLSRELRDAAIARANAARQPLVSRIAERLHMKRNAAQDTHDVTRAHAV